MISKVKSTNLVEIFFYLIDACEKEFKTSCERFSNNRCHEFSDQETMTLYLFCSSFEKCTRINQGYNFTKENLLS